MANLAIIGIGNPFRGDDGAGWAVIDALEKKVSGHIPLHKIGGDIVDLLEYFSLYSTLYLIDACSGSAKAGEWQRIDPLTQPLLLDKPQTSTHGLSIAEAISLAKSLNQLPSKLIIYAINGDHYEMSHALSLPVANAIAMVAERILQEEDIRSCMKKV